MWVCDVAPQQSPATSPPPLTPSRAFEEDIYKPLVWQRGEGVGCFISQICHVLPGREASCADESDRVRAGRAATAAERVQGRARTAEGPPLSHP